MLGHFRAILTTWTVTQALIIIDWNTELSGKNSTKVAQLVLTLYY